MAHGNTGRVRPDLAELNKKRAKTGLSATSTYSIWRTMVARCTKPGSKDFFRYGAKGITVCARWMRFEEFLADMGERPSTSMSLDRRDNTKGYSPDNCRWATNIEQSRNRSTNKLIEFRGETKPLAQWAEDLGIERKTLQMRIRGNWTVERALTTPYEPRKAG